MTNEEALKIVFNSITKDCNPCNCGGCIKDSSPCFEYKAIKQIEKDLEVLEILKELLKYPDFRLELIWDVQLYIGDGEKIEKVKDWLDV